MTINELITQLNDIEDKNLKIEVSVDMSTCDEDAGNRISADTLHLVNQGSFVTLICENGIKNY